MIGLTYTDRKNFTEIHSTIENPEIKTWIEKVLARDAENREKKSSEKRKARCEKILNFLKECEGYYLSTSEMPLEWDTSLVGRDLKYLVENGCEGKIFVENHGGVNYYCWREVYVGS